MPIFTFKHQLLHYNLAPQGRSMAGILFYLNVEMCFPQDININMNHKLEGPYTYICLVCIETVLNEAIPWHRSSCNLETCDPRLLILQLYSLYTCTYACYRFSRLSPWDFRLESQVYDNSHFSKTAVTFVLVKIKYRFLSK